MPRLCLTTSCNVCRFCLSPNEEEPVTMATPTHTVTTDALATLGTIIDATAGRDAIHLAVEPVEAGEKIFPGQHVSLTNGISKASGKLVGIVDPFLPGPVFPGQMFWLVVYPRQITSLRHVWEHPGFPASGLPEPGLVAPAPEVLTRTSAEMKASEAWIENWASRFSLSYDEVIYGARDYLKDGNYLSGGELLEGEYVPAEFWTHYERVTGETVEDRDRGTFFSCSC